MSYIISKDDLEDVIRDYLTSAVINKEQAELLKETITRIVTHPGLETYYNTKDLVYNERDIITKTGRVLRPDRVVINSKNEAIIIDYKTGVAYKEHTQQLQVYQDVLEEMKIKVKKKILVYTNNEVTVKEI